MPLREARPGDEREPLALLAADPLDNVFLIAPLERGLGPAAAACLWPAAEPAGAAVLVRWRVTQFVRLLAAGPAGPAVLAAVAAVIDAHPAERVGALNGRPEVVTAASTGPPGRPSAPRCRRGRRPGTWRKGAGLPTLPTTCA